MLESVRSFRLCYRRADPLVIAILLGFFGIVVLNALGYLVPEEYRSVYGGSAAASLEFARVFGWPPPFLSVSEFVWAYRVALAASWTGYLAILWLVISRDLPLGLTTEVCAILLALIVGLLTPPWMSSDVFLYIAYGRMHSVYELDPYQTLPATLASFADPIAPFINWNGTSRYGYLWTLISSWLLKPIHASSMFLPILLMKSVATSAHLALVFGVVKLSELVDSRWRNAAFVSIAFSPLFVSEGPGSGHNDSLMLALLVWGVVFWQRGRLKTACLTLGLALTIKLVASMLLVWLVSHRVFFDTSARRSTVSLIFVGVLPQVSLQAYFGGDMTAFFSAFSFLYSGLESPSAMPDSGMIPPFVVIAFVCSLATIATRQLHWSLAWTFLTALAIIMIGPLWPWYLMWPGIFLFSGYSKALPYAAMPYAIACFVCMLGYSMLGGQG